MRVGGADLIDVDFRLVAATNRDLEKEVEVGRFREDLYYRLKVVTLAIPALRDRVGDIPLLVEHYLRHFCEEQGRNPIGISPRALDALGAHPWPGNVRELKNMIESLVIFHQGDEIDLADLSSDLRGDSAIGGSGIVVAAVGEVRTMAEIERQAILETLERTGGKRAEAAELLGIGLRTLQRKLSEYREQGFFQSPGD